MADGQIFDSIRNEKTIHTALTAISQTMTAIMNTSKRQYLMH